MTDNNYDTLESIFIIPDDVNASQKGELIASTISRIKSTIGTVNVAVVDGNIPKMDISNTLWMVEGQLEQLEQLIKFEVKEDKL